ncbi:hypothetical protein LUZ61_016871 [Rhynchospora tenuis]|uniref:GRAS family transcription factor n=1 Tax=Rhynchospora tenuis TaxID=198213 RepID=A0AAD6EKG1_9POAL|nr:hypothetical protein LUZ61_016871 [Rhynchospora tenuis]
MNSNLNFHENGNKAPDTPNTPQPLYECFQTTLPIFRSDNLNQNATSNYFVSNGKISQQVCNLTSNAVINYIGQILLEEDIDEDIYQEEAALRDTEKSFYDILGKEYPFSPTWTQFHITTSSNTLESVPKNGMPSYSKFKTPSISADPISSFLVENLSATQIQKGAEEAMKFVPAVGKFFIGLAPKRVEIGEEAKINNVSGNKEISHESHTKISVVNYREPDLSEEIARKQQAVSPDEHAKVDNMYQFLISRDQEYVKEVMSVRETMKQEKCQSDEHHVNIGSKKECKEGLVNLNYLLICCSEVVSNYDYSRASELIHQIRKYSDLKGDPNQRLAHYVVDALEARLTGTGSDVYHELMLRQATVTDFLKAFRVYHAVCPFLRAGYYFSNQTILNISKNATKVHIIDFGIHMGFMWPSFFESLSSLGSRTPKIRITGIEFPEKGFRPAKLVEETGKRLSEYAQRFNIRLKYQGIASKWETIRIEDLKIEKDETLIVNCWYRFKKVPDDTIDMTFPRDKVVRMIKAIKPCIFIHGIVNGPSSMSSYATQFKENISWFSLFFDMFDSNMPRDSEIRLHMERTIVGHKAFNSIACEGSERERPATYRQWQARNLRAGFVQLPVDPLIKKNIDSFVRGLYHKEYIAVEEDKWLLLGWKGRIMFGLSTWKPNEYDQSK